jgi:hypothetical protein
MSYCYSLRNEDHKTIFVLEVVCKGKRFVLANNLLIKILVCLKGNDKETKFDIIDIDQIETVFYILHKCQEELLEESLLGKSKVDFGILNKFKRLIILVTVICFF